MRPEDGFRPSTRFGPVAPAPEPAPGDRLRQALELYEHGVWMMEQNLRRRHPDDDDEAILARLREWLTGGPDAAQREAEGWARVRDVA